MIGAEVDGVEQTLFRMRRLGEKLPKHSLDILRKYEKKMIKSARRYAPRKDGYLEEAIMHMDEIKVGRGRVEIVWGVNKKMLGPGYKKTGFRYDIAMELGEFENRGPGTVEKGPEAGEAYMQRALWDHEDNLRRELKQMAKRFK